MRRIRRHVFTTQQPSWGRRDFVESYALPPDRVTVVPGGSVLREYPAPTPEDLDRTFFTKLTG